MPETTDWLPDWLGDWAIDWLAAKASSSFLPQAERQITANCTSTAARQVQRDANWHTLPADSSSKIGLQLRVRTCMAAGCDFPLLLLAKTFSFRTRCQLTDSGRGFFYFPSFFSPFLFDFLAFSCTNKNRIEIENCFSHTHTHRAGYASITNDILSAWLAFAWHWDWHWEWDWSWSWSWNSDLALGTGDWRSKVVRKTEALIFLFYLRGATYKSVCSMIWSFDYVWMSLSMCVSVCVCVSCINKLQPAGKLKSRRHWSWV